MLYIPPKSVKEAQLTDPVTVHTRLLEAGLVFLAAAHLAVSATTSTWPEFNLENG